jgi:hypothetical protein
MAKRKTGSTDADSGTTKADARERVVALAEQLGRIAGTVQAKAEGLVGRVPTPSKTTRAAAAAPGGAKGRSGGVVDARGKKHRKPPPSDPDAKRAGTQAAKMRTAKTMVKTSRHRGRG